jgi:hypothetical protein
MSDGWLIVLGFLFCLFFYGLFIWMSIRTARREVTRWDGNSTIWFIRSIGNFGKPQIEMWKRRAGYDEDQAKIIIKYQMWCFFGVFVAFCATVSAMMGYKVLTH